MIALMPMFGFLVLAFLLLCAILAAAIYFATRGMADPGRSRINGPGGCAIGCALLVVVGLGLLATLAVVARSIAGQVASHGEWDGWRWRIEPGDEEPEEVEQPIAPRMRELPAPVAGSATEIELAPGASAGPVLAILRRELSAALDVSVGSVERDGESRAKVTIAAPADPKDRDRLRELARRLEFDPTALGLEAGSIREVRGPRD